VPHIPGDTSDAGRHLGVGRARITPGLLSEQIGLAGGQQVNFPQPFTRLALIKTALNLDYQLDHDARRVGLTDLVPRSVAVVGVWLHVAP